MPVAFRRAALGGALSFCILFLGAAFSQCAANAAPIQPDPYALAASLKAEGRYEEALLAVNEALKQAPNRGAGYALRSGLLGNLGLYEEALSDAELALQFSKTPRDRSMAAYNKGFNLTSLGRNPEALRAYQFAVRLDPTYAWGHFGLGKGYYFLHMWKEAKSELDQAIALNPSLAAAWSYRAEALFALKRVEDGMASAEKAIELGPNDPRGFRARAIGFQLLGRFDEMLDDATRLVELQPDRPLSHLLRGRALNFLGRDQDALSEYELEVDKNSVAPFLSEKLFALYGSRVNNPGCIATLFPTPVNNFSLIETCGAHAAEAAPPPPESKLPPKRRPPGLPAPKPKN